MACDGCETSGCCCASLTGLRGGIHPDTIQSTWLDLALDELDAAKTRTYRCDLVLAEPGHIISVDLALVCVNRDEAAVNSEVQVTERAATQAATIANSTPVNVSLYTVPGFQVGDLLRGGFNADDDTSQNRDYICTGSVSSGNPSWKSEPDMFGYFFDGGLFAELNAPNNKYGVRLVVRWIPRLQFVPAYRDPVSLMQHYWNCHREGEFLEGFYGGTSYDVPLTDSSPASSIASESQSSFATNPFSKLSDYSYITWEPIF